MLANFQFSVEARIERTKALGVQVNVLEGRNYDETVDHAKRTSDENGWTFIQGKVPLLKSSIATGLL